MSGKKRRPILGATTVSTAFSTEARVWDRSEKGPLKRPQVSKNTAFTTFYCMVSRRVREARLSHDPQATKEPDREHENSADKTENAVNGDSYQAERQRQQPDKWIEDESQQSQWPTQNE
jgi:hypothetical protein